MKRIPSLLAAVLSAFMVLACGGNSPNEPAPSGPEVSELDMLNRDILIGSQGADVRAVHEYLTRYGYFANAALEEQFPEWRPIVQETPAATDVFDEHSADAIRALQANAGLPRTGIVDERTREILRMPRCGVPDGIADVDPSDKFQLRRPKWNKSTLTFKVLNTVAPFTLDQMQNTVAEALRPWSNQTTLRFLLTSGTADISVQFGVIDGPAVFWKTVVGGTRCADGAGKALAYTSPGDSQFSGDFTSQTIVLDQQEQWSTASGAVYCTIDMLSVLTHEVGHALGLFHSSDGTACMWAGTIPNDIGKRNLAVDDDVAISTRYDTWKQVVPNAVARDIGVGPDGTMWVIDNNPWGDGFRVAKYNGFCCFDESDGGAVRVAVGPGGIPWVVTASGYAYRHTTNNPKTGVWSYLNGAGYDIGVGYNGEAWIVGLNNVVWKWDEANGGWVQDHMLRNAVKVTVDANGVPYILDSANHFWQYSNNDPITGSWISIPGLSSDLAIGPGNYLWSLGGPVGAGLVSLAVWNQQAATGDGSSGGGGSASVSQWSPPGGIRPSTFGSSSNVAVGPTGNPWFIDGSGQVWTTVD